MSSAFEFSQFLLNTRILQSQSDLYLMSSTGHHYSNNNNNLNKIISCQHIPHFAETLFKPKEEGLGIYLSFVCYSLFELAGRWTVNNKLFLGGKKYGQSKL